MPVDFYDSHIRHFADAEFLLKYQRLANADQLFGLSAECGLKAIMEKNSPGFYNPQRPDSPQQKYRKHINELWGEYCALLPGSSILAKYSLSPQNPFDNWDISQRYKNKSAVTKNNLTKHQKGAKEIRKIVSLARLDGIIP